ncbi:ATP cone domain-containing protein [Lentisphaerota bacterium WC36G]|nr:hypothetical protein LJT99_13595 [Lentisphaerae bacterium WC36]
MIKISDYSLKVMKHDGSIVDFEVERLQSGIIKSCLEAGVREVWIAEDIALSIEYALMQAENQQKYFSISDINSLVIKILEKTGYADVAEVYLRTNSTTEVKYISDYAVICDLISKHLSLHSNKLTDIASSVVQASEMLNIDEANPSLYIELAKFYRDRQWNQQQNRLALDEVDHLQHINSSTTSSWLLHRRDILEQLNAPTIELINNRIIHIAGISQLFPAIKIDFRISRFAGYLELDIPITEMVMIPNFNQIAEALDDIVNAVRDLYNRSSNKGYEEVDFFADYDFSEEELLKQKDNLLELKDGAQIPVYLNVSDMSAFACKQMFSTWPEAASGCRDMLSFLEKMLNFNIFKIIVK